MKHGRGRGVQDETRPWVIAHRGASHDCPENTLAAFDEALAQGADGIELDVQLSRDGVPVVWHDWTLARAGGGRRRVDQLDGAALGKLDPGGRLDRRFRGQHIPTLEEVLARYGRRTRLLVELKLRRAGTAAPLVHATAALLERMDLQREVLVLSFDSKVLEACRVALPSLGRVLNLDPPRRLTRALTAQLGGLAALSANVQKLTPGFAAELGAQGCSLFVYTCNSRVTVARALRCGARAIMSDRPAWLAATIAASPTTDAT